MVKKRRKLRSATADERKVKNKEPDPNSEDFIYDDVEKFHRAKDKILLDPSQEDEESELEESENEEVLALPDSEDSDVEMGDEENDDDHDDDDDDDVGDNESESSSSEDDGLPSDKAWGKNKKAFYDADVQDEDIEASDEEAELAAAEEEKEAIVLQKRMTEKLDESDFFVMDDGAEIDEHLDEEEKKKDASIMKDLSKLSKREKLEILAKQSPELLPLLEEFKEKLGEVKDTCLPLMGLIEKDLIRSNKSVVYIQAKYQLLMNYLINVSFYLLLKSQKGNVNGHPVIDILVKYKQLLAQMEPLDEKMETEIEELLKIPDDIANSKRSMTGIKKRKPSEQQSNTAELLDLLKKEPAVNSKKNKKKKIVDNQQSDQGDTIDPLEYYNRIKEQKELRNLQMDENGDVDDENVEYDDEDEDGKRRITYEMSKNKGLTRKRRKELKNPRVKHKMKFKKAQIKHKSQVREVQREMVRYGGELTGIKSSLSRSVKIK